MKKGFTLIELLAVIIILAIITLIATPIVLNVINDARKSAGMSEAQMVYSGIKSYCATSAMKAQLDGTEDICADGITIDEVSKMIDLGNSKVTKITYTDGKITELMVESNHNIYTMITDGRFAIEGDVEGTITPTVAINYDISKMNANGWFKEDVIINITGEDDKKYCISSIECEPIDIVDGTITISTEGVNYVCAIASNGISNSEKVCQIIKLDKTVPTVKVTGKYENQSDFVVSVEASDTSEVGSGIDKYAYYYKETSEPDYKLVYTGDENTSKIENLSSSGSYNIRVIVTDKAGNEAVAETTAGTSCFTAGTLVYTENGYKNIEDIKIGEKVYAINIATDEIELKPILNKFVGKSNQIYTIKVENDIIEVTPKHQFYVVDKGWIRAYDLKVGDELISKNGNLRIDSIILEKLEQPVTVYNMEVDGLHNYLVTKYSILVHNAFTPSVTH